MPLLQVHLEMQRRSEAYRAHSIVRRMQLSDVALECDSAEPLGVAGERCAVRYRVHRLGNAQGECARTQLRRSLGMGVDTDLRSYVNKLNATLLAPRMDRGQELVATSTRGEPPGFKEYAPHVLITERRVMRYLLRNTNIPVP